MSPGRCRRRTNCWCGVHAATINRIDRGFRAAHPWFIRSFAGITRPRRTVLGHEFAEVVAAVGEEVRRFAFRNDADRPDGPLRVVQATGTDCDYDGSRCGQKRIARIAVDRTHFARRLFVSPPRAALILCTSPSMPP